MRNERSLGGALLLFTLGLSACSGGGDAPSGEGYNVLLISLDSTRRDLLGAYGFESPYAPGVSPSPNLDALADGGVLLRDAYSTTSWTLPSHMSLLTGQPELVHAVDIDYLRPDPSRRTLAELLRTRGYATSGFFSGPYLDSRFGFAEGFDRYEACYGPTLSDASKRMLAAYERAAQAAATGDARAEREARAEALELEGQVDGLSHRDVSSTSIVDAAAEAMAASVRAGQPFFVFAHFFDPHYDYVPPEPFDRFDPDYAGDVDGEDFWTNPAVSEFDRSLPSGRRRTIGDRDLEHIRALYAGELAWTDAEVGRLLDKLDELGVAERTLVIVTADHGDEFFEHDAIGHRRTLYEEVVQVPMILRMPGVLPAGADVDGLVANNDVYATVLELLEMPAVPGMRSDSMVGLIRGADDGAERAVFGRLLTALQITLQVPSGDQRIDVQGTLFTLQETYRKGPIKITRRREWPEPAGDVPLEVGTELRRTRDQHRAREVLRWIDVERYPGEPEAMHSTDFTSPSVRALLQEFHDAYGELLRDRAQAGLQGQDEPPLAGMEGLGYTDGASAAVSSDLFVLPPPGRDLLRDGR
ncbi:MAG: sulfatase [Planctomycetota bacterium]